MANNNTTNGGNKARRIDSPRDKNNNNLMLLTQRYGNSVLRPNEPTVTLDDWQKMRREEEAAKRRGMTNEKSRRTGKPKASAGRNINIGPLQD